MVGQILTDNYWFYLDSHWTGPKKEAKTAAYVVPHFVLKAPIDTNFNQDFETAKKNLQKIINSKWSK